MSGNSGSALTHRRQLVFARLAICLVYVLFWGFIAFVGWVFTEDEAKFVVGIVIGAVTGLPVLWGIGAILGRLMLSCTERTLWMVAGTIVSSLVGSLSAFAALYTLRVPVDAVGVPLELWLVFYVVCSLPFTVACAVIVVVMGRLIQGAKQ